MNPIPGQPCEGCEPVPQDNLTPPTVQVVTPGRPQSHGPHEQVVQEMARGVMVERSQGRLDVPTGGSGMPSWAVELMNNVRSLHIEVAVLGTILKQVGQLLSEANINATRVNIVEAVEREFRAMVAQLDRSAAQRPAAYSGRRQP